MSSLVLGFSIDKQIEQIGAICGFAAVLGLAVLSLLYFAQAREVRRLREWAGRAPERDADLQQRVAEDAARRAGVAPAAAAPADKIVRAEREVLDPKAVEDMFDQIGLLVLEGDAAGLAARVADLSAAREAPALRDPA